MIVDERRAGGGIDFIGRHGGGSSHESIDRRVNLIG